MDNIFGVPMSGVLAVTVGIMGLCLLTVAIIALRNRVIFKMAIRNIPRRKAQTILIMVGLMLSTLIIAASLTTGDTLDYSIKKQSFEGLSEVDQTIAFVGETGNEGSISINNTPIPAGIADALRQRFENDPDIDAVMPMLTIGVPVVNIDARLSEPGAIMTGLDPEYVDGFGGLQTPSGEEIDFASLGENEVVISEDLAGEIGASTGDQLVYFYNNQPQQVTVNAIAKGSILTGLSIGGGSADLYGIAAPLQRLQAMTGLEGQASFIAVSNTGGVEDGADRTDASVAKLRAALDEIEGGDQLGVNPIKADAIEGAEMAGNQFMTFFILFGLFSVAAGVLLIFLIFTMLAAERRAEMGMARAVGMKRRHLIQGFIAEGAAYDLGAALIGAALGVAVAFAIAGVMGALLGDFIVISPYANPRSLIVAYSLGVTVTFITIIFASVRASRLNIVQAIRDLPEFSIKQQLRPRRKSWNPFHLIAHSYRLFKYYIGWSPIVGILGVVLMLGGISAESIFQFSMGFSILGLGLAVFLRRFLPDRPVFTTIAAIQLAFWLLPQDALSALLPDLGSGGIEMFFVSGIFMVTYTTLIIMWNAEVVVAIISVVGRLASRWLPAVKTAVAYPLAAKGRTGMTIAMFSLVIFSLVTLTTLNSNFIELFSSDDADAGYDVQVITSPANPVDDLRAALEGTDVDTSRIEGVGRVASIEFGNTQIREPGEDDWQNYVIAGLDQSFIENATIPFQSRAEGYASDAEVWEAVQNNPDVVVVDPFAVAEDTFGSDPNMFNAAAYEDREGVFTPFQIEIENPRNGEDRTVTVIGVIDSTVSTMFGIFMGEQGFETLYGRPDAQAIWIRMAGTPTTEDAVAFARQIESALLERGVQAISINEQIEEQLSISNSFLKLLQGFMGLGLVVGIAALGVISFRSVVERRQQIGMLRAIGYQKGMVATSFLLESLVIAGLGVLSGTVLALILSYNLINSDDFSEGAEFSGFVVPWLTIVLMIGASLIAAALMTWVPARKASSVPIAEALRYE